MISFEKAARFFSVFKKISSIVLFYALTLYLRRKLLIYFARS